MLASRLSLSTVLLASLFACGFASAEDPWITFAGGDGPGKGKHIVLVSGDEEYRSEEALPQLAKILSQHHGFQCTVVFAIDPNDGTINPNVSNIPGLEALDGADLMIIATRFRDLPDEQMKHIADFVEAGKPIVGLRTATHAFNIKDGKTYADYSFRSKNWDGGFGRQVLGETWISHHGKHKSEAARGILVKEEASNPILRGLKDGDVFAPSDVYGVTLPLPGDSKPIVLGQVVAGMKFDDPPLEGKKNDPMMPIAWTKTYKAPKSGKIGRAFATTTGAATDLAYEGTRRLIVNGAYWAVGLEDKIPEKSNVDLVGEYNPTMFSFGGFIKGKKPADYAK
jgi:type 1 glutamine amidotransferase